MCEFTLSYLLCFPPSHQWKNVHIWKVKVSTYLKNIGIQFALFVFVITWQNLSSPCTKGMSGQSFSGNLCSTWKGVVNIVVVAGMVYEVVVVEVIDEVVLL